MPEQYTSISDMAKGVFRVVFGMPASHMIHGLHWCLLGYSLICGILWASRVVLALSQAQTPPLPAAFHWPLSSTICSVCGCSPWRRHLHDVMQMVRETTMTAEMRPSSSHTTSQRPETSAASTIPAWLAETSAAAQRSGGPASCSNRSRSGRSQGARSGSAVSPSYHRLSLELIKSMSDKGEHHLSA